MIQPIVEVLSTSEIPDSTFSAIRFLSTTCFPNMAGSGVDFPTSGDEIVQRLFLGRADPKEIVWIFLCVPIPNVESVDVLPENRIVGFVTLSLFRGRAFVNHLCAVRSMRGWGLRKTLLMHCARHSIDRFSQNVLCGTVDWNSPGLHKYYQRLGGRFSEEQFAHFPEIGEDGSVSPRFVVMEGKVDESEIDLGIPQVPADVLEQLDDGY